MKRMVLVLAVLLVLIPAVRDANAQTYTLDQVLAKMNQVNRNFRSMEASIERTTVDVIVDSKDTEFGKVYFKRGKNGQSMMRFEFTRPSPHTALIADGKAHLYNPKLKQVQEYDLGKDSDKAEFLLVGFGQTNEQLKQTYNVTMIGEDTIDGQKMSVIELKPKSERVAAMFSVIRLWVDQKQWIPLQTKATESGKRGDYQILKFTSLKLNPDINDSMFKLNLPKDVQVVK